MFYYSKLILCFLCTVWVGNVVADGNNKHNTTVIYNVSLISMLNDQARKNIDVVIKDGKIVAIEPYKSSRKNYHESQQQEKLINGEGKFLMPGLVDMHVHLPGNTNIPWYKNNGIDNIEDTLFMYIANGVTTVRSMYGEPYILLLRNNINNGKLLGPRIFTASPSIDGSNIGTLNELKQRIIYYKAAGYDSIKLRPGLNKEQFNTVVSTSRELRIPFIGHILGSIGIRDSIRAGYKSIEHLDGYVEGLVENNHRVIPERKNLFGYLYSDKVDMSLLPLLIKQTKEANVWITPTQSMLEKWNRFDTEDLSIGQGMQYISREIISSWKNVFKDKDLIRYVKNSDKFLLIRGKIIKKMNKHGVKLLMGSDSPQMYSVPGFSALDELRSLVAAGLNNYEVIKTATVNPAQYFNKTKQFGSIQIGAAADMILLESNPLENIENLRKKVGVFIKGKWISSEDISNRLDMISKKYSS